MVTMGDMEQAATAGNGSNRKPYESKGSLNPAWVRNSWGSRTGGSMARRTGTNATRVGSSRTVKKADNRAAKLRALGNAVVPQVAQEIGKWLQRLPGRLPPTNIGE